MDDDLLLGLAEALETAPVQNPSIKQSTAPPKKHIKPIIPPKIQPGYIPVSCSNASLPAAKLASQNFHSNTNAANKGRPAPIMPTTGNGVKDSGQKGIIAKRSGLNVRMDSFFNFYSSWMEGILILNKFAVFQIIIFRCCVFTISFIFSNCCRSKTP